MLRAQIVPANMSTAFFQDPVRIHIDQPKRKHETQDSINVRFFRYAFLSQTSLKLHTLSSSHRQFAVFSHLNQISEL